MNIIKELSNNYISPVNFARDGYGTFPFKRFCKVVMGDLILCKILL